MLSKLREERERGERREMLNASHLANRRHIIRVNCVCVYREGEEGDGERGKGERERGGKERERERERESTYLVGSKSFST